MEKLRSSEIMSFSFDRAYHVLEEKGPARVISGTGVEYTIEASAMTKGKLPVVPVIRVQPRSGFKYIRYTNIHADCWGNDVTCQGSRVEDIYRGKNNIYRWLEENTPDNPDTIPKKR